MMRPCLMNLLNKYLPNVTLLPLLMTLQMTLLMTLQMLLMKTYAC